ncbi:MAG: sterol desaturase family protein [Myxococcota bacterium]
MAVGAAALPSNAREAGAAFFRHASPRVLVVASTLALGVRIGLGGFGWLDLVPVAVIALWWPLQEWLIHVFVLHSRPRVVAGRTWDFSVPRKHRAHHADPFDPSLIFIPIHSYLYTVPILVGVCWLLTPTPALAATAVVTYLAGTLHYEAVHFLVHTRVTPRTAYYRRLWRNHRLHHFKNEHYWYGVTRLEADRWLGTAPAAETTPPSPTARNLTGT